MKPLISFPEFDKIDLRIGTIINCVKKEESRKLLRLTVDFGKEGQRNILTGLAEYYQPEKLIGKSFLFIINLEPRKMMGEESQGMILCAEGKKPLPLKTITKTFPGAPLR